MTVQPDTGAALEFLRLWAPDGPWVLTAITPDRKSIDTRTFRPSSEEECRAWISGFNGARNLYFHVNPPIRDLTKKAEREDILELAWLHVDIDPRAGENVAEEQERALSLLTTKLPPTVPPPTCVIFSGGGYQGFWKLAEPVRIEGDLALAEDAKRYNQQLELLFGADNCHNIDRIMRLPGTVNIPNAQKLKKGRTPALACLVEFHPDRVYPLGEFTQAAAVQIPEGQGFNDGRTVTVPDEVDRLSSVDELDQWQVPDRLKIIAVQGHHPDEPKQGDNSRSSWIFDFCCNMIRCGVPDEVLYSILTDPDFRISESVLEKGSSARRYALRQIERAKEEADDPWLRQLNERYCVIGNIGGKCRVVEEVRDEMMGRSRYTKKSFEDFCNFWMNKYVQVGQTENGKAIMKPVGQWWLRHQKRRQYDSVVFAPNREVEHAYNLWKGYGCAAVPGDCALYLSHLMDNVCAGVQEHYDYLLGWMARAVQKPDCPGEVAVVLRGGRGTGKSITAKEFGKLFGRHFMHVANSSHLVGNFNAHLRDVVVLFGDEAFYAGDRKHDSILKTLITEETLTIESKGVDVETSPNFIHLIMASNSQHVVPAGGDERRYFVLDMAPTHQQDTAYFRALVDQMENGGREALLHFLSSYDLSGFEVRSVPQTEALREQKLLSLSVEEEWWYQKLEEGCILSGSDGWPAEVLRDSLTDDYIEYTRRFNVSRRGNQTALGRFLNRVVPGMRKVQRAAQMEVPAGDGFMRTVHRERAYFYVLPTIGACRARWDELYGPQPWGETAPEQARLDTDTPF